MFSSGKRASTKRLGGALSLVGGVTYIGVLFLPWLDYLAIVPENDCFQSGCHPFPYIPNVTGLDLLANNPLFFFLMGPLFLLMVAAILGSGLLRLLASRREGISPWFVLWVLVASLVAFGLVLIVPPPSGTYIEYSRIAGQHYKPGMWVALAALLTALLGSILQLEPRPRPS